MEVLCTGIAIWEPVRLQETQEGNQLVRNFGKSHIEVAEGYLQWMVNNLENLLKVRGKMKLQKQEEKAICNFLTDLKYCSRKRDLQWGKRIHLKVMKSQHDSNMYVVTALITMYGRCGCMVDARRIFDSIQMPEVLCWTALLLGYAMNGESHAAFELFSKMKSCGCRPNSFTYIAVLKACTSLAKKQGLKWGSEIHGEIGYDLDIFVQSTLIEMYGKCGSMADALHVFESIPKPNVVCWNALLLGYLENGEGLNTLEFFSRMKTFGCAPDFVTYIIALKACAFLAGKRDNAGQGEWLKRGRQIHSQIGCHLSLFLQSTLIDMYGKCGSMTDARCVFENMQNPDAVSWNALLLGYAENGDGFITLELFLRMKACECAPDSVTYIAALKACMSCAEKQDGDGQGEWLKKGREIHSEIDCVVGFFLQSTLIDMYGKCGSMEDACLVFESIQNPNVVCWNALLLGYAENGNGFAALEQFSRMKTCGCAPDSVTYIAALKACGLIGALVLGLKLHSEITEFNDRVVTCLVDFYVKCGSIIKAREVFDTQSKARDVSTWTALLTGYGSFGDTVSVFNLFQAMQDQGFKPNAVTFVCILSCCGHAGLVEKAREYFEVMPMQYGVTPTLMHYNCMVDILGRANQLNEAVSMLRKMPCKPDAVTWMTLLSACRKWKRVEIGRCAFHSLVDIDEKNTAAYVLMAHIYGSRGMWEEQERVLEARLKFGAGKHSRQAYV